MMVDCTIIYRQKVVITHSGFTDKVKEDTEVMNGPMECVSVTSYL